MLGLQIQASISWAILAPSIHEWCNNSGVPKANQRGCSWWMREVSEAANFLAWDHLWGQICTADLHDVISFNLLLERRVDNDIGDVTASTGFTFVCKTANTIWAIAGLNWWPTNESFAHLSFESWQIYSPDRLDSSVCSVSMTQWVRVNREAHTLSYACFKRSDSEKHGLSRPCWGNAALRRQSFNGIVKHLITEKGNSALKILILDSDAKLSSIAGNCRAIPLYHANTIQHSVRRAESIRAPPG